MPDKCDANKTWSVYRTGRHEMTIAAEKPVSASTALPKKLEDLIDESINAMSKKELRAWKRDSEKIMNDSRNRSGASSVRSETSR
jgi:hypothetical protein